MNLIEIAKKLKYFTDAQLLEAMQKPSGTTPGYLVMAELNRRKEARPNNPPKTTVMQDLTEMMPQQIPMGQMPGTGYKKGGKVEVGPSEIERIARARQQEADTQAYWAEMIPESDVLAAKVISDSQYNPPVTMDERQFATRRALNLGPFSGLRNMRFDDQVREGLGDAPGVYGMTDANVATRGNPTVFINPKNMRNYAGGVGTQNHELGHVALTPLRESFEKDNRVGAIPLEHMVINAMRAQTGLSKEDKDFALRQLRAHGESLNQVGRSYKKDYAAKAGNFIDWLQGMRPNEPQHRNGALNSLPYRRVDTAIMRKDIEKYAHGGIVDLAEYPVQIGEPGYPEPIGTFSGDWRDGIQLAEAPSPDAVPTDLRYSTPLAPGAQPKRKPVLDPFNTPWRKSGEPEEEYRKRRAEQEAAKATNTGAAPGEPPLASMPYDPMTSGWLTPAPTLMPPPVAAQPTKPVPPRVGNTASGAPSPTPTGSTWHWRQNNPGNIRMTEGSLRAYPGAKPGANGFLAFETPEQGLAAIDQTWRNIAKTRGVTTPRQIISVYAPKGDGSNDPDAYAAAFQKLTGIDPDKPIDLSDTATMQKVRAAVAQIETGTAGPGAPSGSKVPPTVARGREDESRFDALMAKYGNKENPYSDLQRRLDEIESRRGKREDTNLNMALINAGLGMMASKSPYPLVAAGEAGLNALKGYREDEKSLREDEMLHLSAAAKMKEAEIAYRRGDQQLAFELMREANANRRHAETLREGTRSLTNQFMLKNYEHGLTQKRDAQQARAKFVTDVTSYNMLLTELRTKLKREPTQVEIDAAIDARLGYGTRPATPGGTAKAATHRYEPGKGLVPVQ